MIVFSLIGSQIPFSRHRIVSFSFQQPLGNDPSTGQKEKERTASGMPVEEKQSCYPGTWALRLILVTDPSSSVKQDW